MWAFVDTLDTHVQVRSDTGGHCVQLYLPYGVLGHDEHHLWCLIL